MYQIKLDTFIDPEGHWLFYDKGDKPNDEWPDWITFHWWNRSFTGFAPKDANIYEFSLKCTDEDYDGVTEAPFEFQVIKVEFI